MPVSKPTELTEEQVQLIAKALADSRRYEIIKRISQCKEAMACETVRGCLDISAPTLSHHMKELEVAGLVHARRTGKIYQLPASPRRSGIVPRAAPPRFHVRQRRVTSMPTRHTSSENSLRLENCRISPKSSAINLADGSLTRSRTAAIKRSRL